MIIFMDYKTYDESSIGSIVFDKLVFDDNGKPSFNFDDLISQVKSLYNQSEETFNIPNQDFLLNFLNKTIFSLQNFKTFSTDLCFFRFFIYLLTSYNNGNSDDDILIKEKIIFCSSYFVISDLFDFNDLSVELLISTFQYLQNNPISIIVSINAIKNKNYSQAFIANNIVDQVIEMINQKIFNQNHFYFLSQYAKHMKNYIMNENPQLIQKLLQISYEYSNKPFGFFLLSKIVKHYGQISTEIDQIIKKELSEKNFENIKSLLRILYYYSIINSNFFDNQEFFDIFYQYFEICDLKMKLKYLDIVYMLVPHYSKELLLFVFYLLEISVSSNYDIFSKICEIMILYFQTIDEQRVSDNFINIKIFEIFEKLLATENSMVYIKVIEILMYLNGVNKKLFDETIIQSSILDTLESLTTNENDYIQKISLTALKHFKEGSDDEYD